MSPKHLFYDKFSAVTRNGFSLPPKCAENIVAMRYHTETYF